MIKRTFRFGVLVGLLAGAAAALVKLLGGRSGDAPLPAAAGPTAAWPRLEEEPRPTPAPAPAAAPAPAPAERPTRTAPITAEPITAEPGPAEPGPAEPGPAEPSPAEVAPEPPPPAAAKPAAKKGTTKRKAPVRAWVEPEGDVCPTSHPIKAKLASKIFHQPGMLNYGRTRPDRCYLNEASAEADGLRPAKR